MKREGMVWHLQSDVRQGGVLSPVFFNVYIRFMLDEIKLSDVKCRKDHVYIGYLAYYIILLSALIRGLIIK